MELDPIEDTMRVNLDRRKESAGNDRSQIRQPLREIRGNVRLRSENKKRSMFRRPTPPDRLTSKSFSTATFDGFDNRERRLPTRAQNLKRSPYRPMRFSGSLPLTKALDVEPMHMTDREAESIEDPMPPVQSSVSSRSAKRANPSDLITRFKQLEVTSVSNYDNIQRTEKSESVKCSKHYRQSSSNAEILNELATLTAPTREEDSDEETNSVDNEDELDDQASVDWEDRGSESSERQGGFMFVNNNVPFRPRSVRQHRDATRPSRIRGSTYVGTKTDVRDNDAFADYLNAEEREEYLS